jgi:hypothetical protein
MKDGGMSLWIVRVTWNEDENEVAEAWEINAASVGEAVSAVAARLRYQPHHVDARRVESTDRLMPGEIRRVPATGSGG